MAETGHPAAEPTGKRLVLTRVFDAPRELVFKAWTEAERLARWWGPNGFTNPVCQADPRPGGAIRIDMRAPDGAIFPMTGVFREVVAPERLVFSSYAIPNDGGDALIESITTVTFVEQDGKTRVTVEAVVVKARPEARGALDGMEQGWSESLDRLAELVRQA